ncbi:MAG: protein-disulfide reductase DsbD domain-containing protein [Pseudomonadota bacterium]
MNRPWACVIPRSTSFAVLAIAGFLSTVEAVAANAIFGNWDVGYASRARLLVLPDARPRVVDHALQAISPDAPVGSAVLAGIQIEMTEGYKTYWRHPGTDGGIPPELDWSRSTNVKTVTVGYPAPKRYVGEAGYSVGYKNSVILPVVAEPLNASQPMTLRLGLFYGVCKEICIPAEAALSATLPSKSAAGFSFGLPSAGPVAGQGSVNRPSGGAVASGPDAIAASRLVDAVYSVPRRVRGEAGLPRVVSSRIETEAGRATLLVEAAFGVGANGTDLFAEAPRGVFIGSVDMLSETPDGQKVFAISLPDGLPAASKNITEIDVTLVGSAGMITTAVPLK